MQPMQFFICSYGGCASWTVARFLRRYGTIHHIHSRKPPEYLTLPVSQKILHRWFGGGAKEHFSNSPSDRIQDTSTCSVLYLYVKPVYSIFSKKAFSVRHLKSIDVSGTNLRRISRMSRSDYLRGGVDLISYEQFFDNYVSQDINRNYNIVAVNVHKLWNHLPELFEILNLPQTDIESFPHERSREREKEIQEHLDDIYAHFNQRIDNMKPIVVVHAKKV